MIHTDKLFGMMLNFVDNTCPPCSFLQILNNYLAFHPFMSVVLGVGLTFSQIFYAVSEPLFAMKEE